MSYLCVIKVQNHLKQIPITQLSYKYTQRSDRFSFLTFSAVAFEGIRDGRRHDVTHPVITLDYPNVTTRNNQEAQ